MTKKSTRRITIGQPEHVISDIKAKQLLTNQLLYKPKGDQAEAITNKTITKNDLKLADEKSDAAAKRVASTAIDKLTGKAFGVQKFDKLTVESLGMMSDSMLQNTVKLNAPVPELAELPASNGKILTTHQMLRLEKATLVDTADSFSYAKDARYSKDWTKGDFKLTTPRGGQDIMEDYNALVTPDPVDKFTLPIGEYSNPIDEMYDQADEAKRQADLTDTQWEAIGQIYSNTNNSEMLDDLIDVRNGELEASEVRTAKPVLVGAGPHNTTEDYDFEEHETTLNLDDLNDNQKSLTD